MHNDFESMAGWMGPTPSPSLTTEKAHSGKYALKVDGNTEFSLGYNNMLGMMSKARISKIKIEAWVFSPSAEAGALLVTTISDGVADHKPMLWDGFDVVKASDKHNEWVQVSKVIDVPASVNYSSHLGLYLWRNKGTLPTYIDDITITEAP